MAEKDFTFDVEMYATFTVRAETAEEAEKILDERVSGADANFGAWANGDPIISEVGIVEEGIHLVEKADVE